MHDFFPGLAGVPAARSKISFIDGQQGILEYRGIPIEQLAESSTFSETTYLLLYDRLPSQRELDQFDTNLRHHRYLRHQLINLIKCLPKEGHPMDALQAAVAAIGMFYPTPPAQSSEENYWAAIRLISKLPTIVATFTRLRRGDEPIQPRDDLAHTANFLYMCSGQVQDATLSKALDTCLILHAEHTMNASTFSGLVTASTLSDPYTVIASAIGTLKGRLHGGANEQVIGMLHDIGSAGAAKAYIRAKLEVRERVMGFGHRIYKVKDPRATFLQNIAKNLCKRSTESHLYEIAIEVERTMNEMVGHKAISANVDFYSGLIYHHIGIETDLYTSVFAIARVAGWLAHCFEQYKDNRLFRPDQIYEGQRSRPYVEILDRTTRAS
ncbi:MAG: citrate synthase [Nitrospiraceae bacterium]|nr:citrate synthase [Nitrospiraceae bacterium]|tara:strand:- start:1260 stop:2405 length:1146 start_codon:yes stop_codon:yes gene_type:complete